jgi:F-type H+-transporting ATPase subunit b
LFGAVPAFAAEEHAAPITQLLYPLINFLIFVYILKRFALPAVKSYLSERRESILKTINEAVEEKTQAEAVVRDYRERLARLTEETQRLKAEFQSEGEGGKRRLLREAEALAAKIQSDAHLLIEQELKVARQQLRSDIARVAHETAQAVLQRHLSAADRKRLAEEFIREVTELR